PPPPAEILGETICVMFIGSVYPSPEEIQKMTPLLARRNVVWDLLNLLKINHSGYKDVVLSRTNLDAVLPNDNPSIPTGVFISHLPSTARETESSGYTNDRDETPQGPEIPSSANGVISNSIEGLTIRENKALAIKHWKTEVVLLPPPTVANLPTNMTTLIYFPRERPAQVILWLNTLFAFSNEVQTTPLANKIQSMAVSETSAGVDDPKDASGAGLQASDDEDDSITAAGAKSTAMRKLISNSDDDEDDSSGGFQGTSTPGVNTPVVAPIPDEVAEAWGFSQLTTFKAKKLADVNDGTTFAMRRLPRGIQYGMIGTQKDRLIVDGKVLTIILVGRVASMYFQDTKSIASAKYPCGSIAGVGLGESEQGFGRLQRSGSSCDEVHHRPRFLPPGETRHSE
ncbi:hypothetical protein M407DRAFT_13315, partial [Tulasnella calospora MUT 4182]